MLFAGLRRASVGWMFSSKQAAGHHDRRVKSRAKLLQICFALGFTGLTWSYAAYYSHFPRPLHVQSLPADARLRGRILTREGHILAAGRLASRVYPLKVAAPLIGFTGKDGGLEGLEATFNAWLSAGNDLRLTLDAELQSACELILEEARREFQAEHGSIIVMEAKTGKLLAVASAPAYQPQEWREASPSAWRNRAFLDQYEPGSVVKPLVIAAMLDQGLTNPDRLYPTPMKQRIGNFTLHDFNPHGPALNLQGIIRYSSNTGMTRLMQDFPAEQLRQALQAYGFGSVPPGFPVPTASGHLKPSRLWGKIGHANHAFGQGFSASTVQVAAAFNVLANDGLYVSPTLIQSSEAERPPVTRQVLNVGVSRDIRRIMGKAVADIPHNRAAVPGYAVAGKTGTAQLAEGGRYSADKFISVYAGFAPVETPEITVVTTLYAARQGHHGAESSAPMFRRVVEAYLSQQALPPPQP